MVALTASTLLLMPVAFAQWTGTNGGMGGSGGTGIGNQGGGFGHPKKGANYDSTISAAPEHKKHKHKHHQEEEQGSLLGSTDKSAAGQ
jgi:hypothetical protein